MNFKNIFPQILEYKFSYNRRFNYQKGCSAHTSRKNTIFLKHLLLIKIGCVISFSKKIFQVDPTMFNDFF